MSLLYRTIHSERRQNEHCKRHTWHAIADGSTARRWCSPCGAYAHFGEAAAPTPRTFFRCASPSLHRVNCASPSASSLSTVLIFRPIFALDSPPLCLYPAGFSSHVALRFPLLTSSTRFLYISHPLFRSLPLCARRSPILHRTSNKFRVQNPKPSIQL